MAIGKQGSETSEFKTTKWAMIASAGLPLVAMVIDSLTQSGLVENKVWLALLGGIGSVLASLGYTFARGKTKAAEAASVAQMAVVQTLGKPEAD
tara:strand:- start:4649 stop:4930 length:282 start_codon:yes stop_codon:yes gene_type:complete